MIQKPFADLKVGEIFKRGLCTKSLSGNPHPGLLTFKKTSMISELNDKFTESRRSQRYNCEVITEGTHNYNGSRICIEGDELVWVWD